MSDISNKLYCKIDNYCFRPLSNPGEVHLAEKLLYDCYIEEQHWDITPSNPSSITKKNCGRKNCLCLTDYYCDKAYWFGTFKEKELIGCFRVLKYPCTELDKYIPLPDWIIKKHPCELNRLAIHPKFRNHKVITLMLLRLSFDYAFRLSDMTYVTANRLKLATLYKKMGLLETGIFFRYDNNDQEEVELLYARRKDRSNAALYKITNAYIAKNANNTTDNFLINEAMPIDLDPSGEQCPLNLSKVI